VISDDVYEKLTSEVDIALEEGSGPFWFVPQEALPQQLRRGADDRVSVEEILIQPGASCDGKHVSEVSWPPNFIIASLNRDDQVIIPSGDTLLQAGDILMAVANFESCQAVRHLCKTKA